MALKGLSLGSPIIGNEANYAAAFATDIAGFRSVANLTSLYAIKDYILSFSGNNTNNDAIGQVWRVTNDTTTSNNGDWRLKDWGNRKAAAGWEKVNNATAGDLSSLTTRVGTAETNIKNLQTTTGTHTSQIGTINNTLGTINTTQLAGLKNADAKNIVSYTHFTAPTTDANSLKYNQHYIDDKGTEHSDDFTFPVATATTVGLMSNSDKAIVDKAITGMSVTTSGIDTILNFNHSNTTVNKIGFINGITLKDNSENSENNGYDKLVSLDGSYFPYVSIGVGSSLSDIDDSVQIVDIIDTASKEQLDINLVFNSAYFNLTSTRAESEPLGSPWCNGEMTLNKTWVDSLATAAALKTTDTKAANAATAAANAQSTANSAKSTAEAAKGVTDTLTTNGYLKASGATYTASSSTLSFPNSKGTNTNIVLPEASSTSAGLMSKDDKDSVDNFNKLSNGGLFGLTYYFSTQDNITLTSEITPADTYISRDNLFWDNVNKKFAVKASDKYYGLSSPYSDLLLSSICVSNSSNKIFKVTSDTSGKISIVEISPSVTLPSIISVTGISDSTATTDAVKVVYSTAMISTGQTANAQFTIDAATKDKAGVMTTAQVTQLNKATQDITNISSNVSSITKLSDQEIISQVTAGWA